MVSFGPPIQIFCAFTVYTLTSSEGVAAFVKGYNQGCADLDPDPDPCFFTQKDPDPLKLTDPYGSVPRIRKILMKIEIFLQF